MGKLLLEHLARGIERGVEAIGILAAACVLLFAWIVWQLSLLF